jgi:hypothetical protein
MKLRATFKSEMYHARVLSDGSVRLAGKIYRSPSMAAIAVCKLSANGC